MMKSSECLKVLARLLPDQIVVATFRAAFEWMAARPSDLNYLSVGAMGLISLPVMLRYGYSTELSAGVIVAAGTLGQIIPPSVVLVVLGDVAGVRATELERLVAAVPDGGVALAPSSDGGTSALMRRPWNAIEASFGPGSAAVHREHARQRSLVFVELALPFEQLAPPEELVLVLLRPAVARVLPVCRNPGPPRLTQCHGDTKQGALSLWLRDFVQAKRPATVSLCASMRKGPPASSGLHA